MQGSVSKTRRRRERLRNEPAFKKKVRERDKQSRIKRRERKVMGLLWEEFSEGELL